MPKRAKFLCKHTTTLYYLLLLMLLLDLTCLFISLYLGNNFNMPGFFFFSLSAQIRTTDATEVRYLTVSFYRLKVPIQVSSRCCTVLCCAVWCRPPLAHLVPWSLIACSSLIFNSNSYPFWRLIRTHIVCPFYGHSLEFTTMFVTDTQIRLKIRWRHACPCKLRYRHANMHTAQ